MKHLILAVCLLSSCRSPADYWSEYRAFYSDAKKRGCEVDALQVYFSPLQKGTAGLCVYYFGIILNDNRWHEYGKYQRLELMYHELGHCALGLDHSDGIMSPSIHSEYEIEPNWSRWKEQLFAVCSLKKQ